MLPPINLEVYESLLKVDTEWQFNFSYLSYAWDCFFLSVLIFLCFLNRRYSREYFVEGHLCLDRGSILCCLVQGQDGGAEGVGGSRTGTQTQINKWQKGRWTKDEKTLGIFEVKDRSRGINGGKIIQKHTEKVNF